ncbi:MAG TPA: D,D-heptose 1,7-bisphosphate phosphatase [Verrucomicrobiales bacterium]|mgnify:CR=1 FL=1|nr:D,D-heptose 1,7-bisphosphate phosphatase [Verrucomicrobiales bacterium]
MRQVVILAGGLGTRLRARLGDLPKPMIPICGRPLLEHQVELARRHGFEEVTLFVCYRPDLIEKELGDGSRLGVRIRYVLEREPLGTAGALLAGWEHLEESFVVMYGDTLVNLDLTRLREAHGASGADGTLVLHPNNHPFDSDLVECGEGGWVTAFHNRPHPAGRWFQNLVNAGLYVIRREALAPFRPWLGARVPGQMLDFGKDLFPGMLRSGGRLLGYNTPEYIKDIGTPERYDKVCAEVASGVVARSSLADPAPAVFLDRDGTLNREADGLRSIDALELLPGAAEGVQRLNQAGLRVVVVTNQPVVAKGQVTEGELREIHNKLESLLGLEHAFVDRIYHCPHHPEKGFPGERPELKIDCDCRKPRPGMLLRAARELNLDLGRSWMVGDTTVDVAAARAAGVKPVLVRTGHGGRDGRFPVQPDFTFDTLAEAARFIVEQIPGAPSTPGAPNTP